MKYCGFLKNISIVFSISIILFGSLPVHAIANDYYSDSDIQLYNPDACDPNGSSSAVSKNTSKSNGGNIYIVGDSITKLAESRYKEKFTSPWSLTINGLVSRHIDSSPPSPSGIEQITQDENKIKDASVVVVALGTNDTGNTPESIKNNVKNTVSKIKSYNPDASLYWVNVMNSKNVSESKKTNNAIRGGVGSDGKIIDWYAAAKDGATLNSFDLGVHPTKDSDIKLLVNTVYKNITKNASNQPTEDATVSPCACSAVSSSTNLSGKDNEEKIWNFFISKGLEPKHAAGIMGNLKEESGYRPDVQEGGQSPPNGGYGIAQWTGTGRPGDPAGARRLNLINAIKDAGISVDLTKQIAKQPIDTDKLLGAELEYLWNEATERGDIDKLKATSNPGEAAQSWMNNFELAKVRIQPKRVDVANALVEKYNGGSSGSTPTSRTGGDGSNSSCGSGGVGGGLSKTVLSYAWPDHHDAPYLERRPDWAKVADNPKSHYVGGTVDGVRGIDCGGFVTMTIRNSGIDPGYNPKKGSTGGAGGQMDYLKDNWEKLSVSTTADLQPGDVAISSSHTFLYVGEIDGFNDVFASASYSTSGNGRAPMAGQGDAMSGKYTWYRNK